MWRLTTCGRFPSDPMVILTQWTWPMFEEAHEVLDFLVEAEARSEEPSAG